MRLLYHSVVYNGCGYNGNNYYNSYQSCMGMCGNNQPPDYIAPQPQPPIQQQQPCGTGCYGDGVPVGKPNISRTFVKKNSLFIDSKFFY